MRIYSFKFNYFSSVLFFVFYFYSSFSYSYFIDNKKDIQQKSISSGTMESEYYHIDFRCAAPNNPAIIICETKMRHKQDSSQNHVGTFPLPKAGKIATDYIGAHFTDKASPEILSHGKVFFTTKGDALIFQIAEQKISVPVKSMKPTSLAPIIYCAIDNNYPKAYYLVDHFDESHHAIGITDKTLPVYLSVINGDKSQNFEDENGGLIATHLNNDLLGYQYGDILLHPLLDKGCNPINLLKPPRNIRTMSGDQKVSLNWQGLNTASQYNIYYSTIANIRIGATGVNQLSTKNNNFTVIGLDNDIRYYFALTVEKNGIESPLSIELSAIPKAEAVAIASMKAINDTNITRCANKESNDLDCPVPSYPRQDAEYGANKQSFSKIDGGRCVKDNITGLMWEVKQDRNDQIADSLHDADDSYTWYEPDNAKNGGHEGFEQHYNQEDANTCYGYQSGNSSSYCNTFAYAQRVNAEGWCGYHDWRVPTLRELRSIVDRGRAGPALNTVYFPNDKKSYVWSSSPYAGDITRVWLLYFYHGYNVDNGKMNRFHVRLVRSE